MEISNKNSLDFLGYIYCPVKETLKDELEKELLKHYEATGEKFNVLVPTGSCDAEDYNTMWKTKDIDAFPDLIAATGFWEYFSKEFTEDMLMKDHFTTLSRSEVNSSFMNMSPEDPKGFYNVYSVMPYVMLVDKKKLSGLPVPKAWKDLLNPMYKNNIIVGYKPDDISEVLLLHFYKCFGDEGLKQLASNVKDAWGSTQIAKGAAMSSKDGAAIYVIPWFFAKATPHLDNLEIVWPEEGAIPCPLYLIAKKDKLKKMKPIIDFITGKSFGEKLAKKFFPSTNAEVDNNLPNNGVINWLGWDFIYSQDINDTIAHVDKTFHLYWDAIYEKERIAL